MLLYREILRRTFFYVPFLYTINTREKGIKGIVSYITKLPLMWLLLTVFDERFDAVRFLSAFFHFYSLYEFGYIYNDCETIKKEIAPTLRVSKEDLEYYNDNKGYIYSFRCIVTVLLFYTLVLIGIKYEILAFTLLIPPVFFVYNSLRSKVNLYIHIILMMLKHLTIIYITLNSFDAAFALFVLLYNPIPFYIELSVRGKFGYRNHILQLLFIPEFNKYYVHRFRFLYQLSFLVVSIVFVTMGFFPKWFLLANVFYTLLMLVTFVLYGNRSITEL